CQHSYYTPYSF
nr:immunoglobulin light chain junction region [Macaca mulatta]